MDFARATRGLLGVAWSKVMKLLTLALWLLASMQVTMYEMGY
jgi:hypothetical protein